MTDQPNPNPEIPAQPAPFSYPLKNLANAMKRQGSIRIVALGSSSTAGRGDVISYPYRLQAALRESFSGRMIDVLNRGVGGEEAPVELKRFTRDVLREKPDLLIWQIGTNAAWKGDDLKEVEKAVRRGLGMLARRPIDVVLMDPQYTPALLRPEKIWKAALDVVARIAGAAAEAEVNLFQRFALMRAWHEAERISLDRFVDPTDPDRLHQSDWSTTRVATALRDVIVRRLAAALSS